jgi:hypothetical protein
MFLSEPKKSAYISWPGIEQRDNSRIPSQVVNEEFSNRHPLGTGIKILPA